MKHWDERDVADVAPARLTRAERQHLRAMFADIPAHRRHRSTVHPETLIGVAMAFTALAALAWLLAPGGGPVSPEILP